MMNVYELYLEVILDHNRNPRNFYKMSQPDCEAEGVNPLCGDKIKLFITLDNNRIIDASFTGGGCAISTASASLMTENLKGKTIEDAKAIFKNFHRAITANDAEAEKSLGKLAVLSGVKAFPVRVKCATLAWHTLLAAIEHSQEVVTTE